MRHLVRDVGENFPRTHESRDMAHAQWLQTHSQCVWQTSQLINQERIGVSSNTVDGLIT